MKRRKELEGLKVWIYCREKHSLEEMEKQENKLVKFAQKNNFKIVGVTKDVSNAEDINRKSIEDLHKLHTYGEFNMLLIASMDKVATNLTDAYKFLHRFEKCGGLAYSIKEGKLTINNAKMEKF